MSNRPWYYVKGHGNRENIERLIASKREKDARRYEFRRQNSDYFDRWQRQNEWIDRKGFKKSALNKSTGNLNRIVNGNESRASTKVPYDLDYEPVDYHPKKNEDIQTKWSSAHQQVKTLLEKMISMERDSRKLEDGEKFFTKQLEDLLSLRRQLKDKQENWSIREAKLYYKRFAKDKLRSKIFLICEQLNYYKIIVDCLSKSVATLSIDEIEKQELIGTIESSIGIINMYLDTNYNRNCEIFPLYNEEAEKQLINQEKLWEREKTIWYNLVDRVMEAFFAIYKIKLEDNFDSQETLREKRVDLLNQISNLKEKFKTDPDLMTIFHEDLNHFLQ